MNFAHWLSVPFVKARFSLRPLGVNCSPLLNQIATSTTSLHPSHRDSLIFRKSARLETTILQLLVIFVHKSSGCPSKLSCTCSDPSSVALAEIHCFNAPLAQLPNLPQGRYYRISIIGSNDIHDLEFCRMGQVTAHSFTLTGSKVSQLTENSFCGTEESLTTLDLSDNHIRQFPTIALSKLKHLQWLSLKGNVMDEIKSREIMECNGNSNGKDGGFRTLVLSDNRLTMIQDGVFTSLNVLETLDLAGNMISRIEGRPFPPSLSSLSLSQNLLETVPIQSLSNLNNLKWLQLRGNTIKTLPSKWFLPSNDIHILDLSHNLLSSIPTDLFMSHQRNIVPSLPTFPVEDDLLDVDNVLQDKSDVNSNSLDYVSIGDLHLDFNSLRQLPEQLFRNVSIKRLSLSQNELSSFHDHLFNGTQLETSLVALDLNFNQFSSFPLALRSLTRITNLFFRGNQLSHLDQGSFQGFKDRLQTLDLGSNHFQRIPKLDGISHLVRLNLQSNQIQRVEEGDLGSWSSSLVSLTLSRNRIHFVSPNAFGYCTSLKELRLPHNPIQVISTKSLLLLQKTLVILELTSTFGKESHSQLWKDISYLNKLEWLELDYNHLEMVANSTLLTSIPNLVHLDLEGNHLTSVPELSGQLNL